ncbi:MAG: TlpA disulfide reductase family protein [Candidatus Omnitrophota bacterium]
MKINRVRFFFVIALVFMISACSNVESQSSGGRAASDFSLETVGGDRVVLSDELKGKNAVLVFFATWCPSCVSEVPAVNDFHNRNKDSVSVMGVNIRESKAKVSNFIEKKNVKYPIVLDTDGAVAGDYRVRGIPAVFAIGKSGKILYSGHSIEEAEERAEFE